MSTNEQVHQLPRKLEKILASLSVYYGQRNEDLLQKLVVNSRYHVIEETGHDNWNGGQTGHTVVFQVPPSIYHEILDSLRDIEQKIRDGISRLDNTPGEYVESVSLEIDDDPSLDNWREKSGLLLRDSPLKVFASNDELKELWEPGCLRLFLSHKAKYKKETAELKKQLHPWGFSCFVAHEDIEPTKKWQDEIEKALFSMHAMVALLTEGFHDSHWTDQEIGVAIGRGVPIITVRMGTDPYGFIGKYQAVDGHGKDKYDVAQELAGLLFKQPGLTDLANEVMVSRFEQSINFNQANMLIGLLNKRLTSASPEVIERIETAFKTNRQVYEANDVKSTLPGMLRRLRRR